MDLKFQQKFRTIYVYRTENYYYFLNCLKNKKSCMIMRIDRNSLKLKVDFEKNVYDLQNGFKKIAKFILDEQPDLQNEKIQFILARFFVLKSYGIIGFPKFLDGYYLHFITEREKICQIFGCNIYRVKEAKLEVLLNQEKSCLYTMNAIKSSEIKYIEYYNGIDHKYFYFSYEIDLTRSIQSIFTQDDKQKNSVSRFLWNTHILKEFYNQNVPNELILPMIYGYIQNKWIKIEMKEIEIGLISRRSRFQVGTRFLKRGLDDNGNVANEVETEFYFIEKFSMTQDIQNVFSYIFYRGSIPIFWKHEKTKISPKPKILIDKQKDISFHVSRHHFEDLFKRYGNVVKIMNLVKKKQISSEFELGNQFNLFFNFYDDLLKNSNSDKQITFNWLDFFDYYNQSEQQLINQIQQQGYMLNEDIGMFHYNFFNGIQETQKGIIRINCVDCLDRTNNSMACISGVILGQMFQKIELNKIELYINQENKSVKNQLLSVVFDLFAKNGDAIANQYAGSEAFHKAQLDQIDGNWTTVKHNIAIIAVKRYLSNILTDFEKQKRFNLFLGGFVPQKKENFKDLWDVMDQEDLSNENCQCDVSKIKQSIFPSQKISERILECSSLKFKNTYDQIPIPIVIKEEIPPKIIIEEVIQKPKNYPIQEYKPIDFEPKLFNFQKKFSTLEKEMQKYDIFLDYVSNKQLQFNYKLILNEKFYQ